MTMLIPFGVFIVGILVRAAVLVLIMTVLALPLLAMVTGMRGLEALWQRAWRGRFGRRPAVESRAVLCAGTHLGEAQVGDRARRA